MTTQPNRRIHERHGLCIRVVFEDEFGEGLFYVNSGDISLGGMRLASAVPLKIGTLLFVSFGLPPHKRPIRVTAEVIRRADDEGKGEVGIRFVGLSEIARKRLVEFLGDGF